MHRGIKQGAQDAGSRDLELAPKLALGAPVLLTNRDYREAPGNRQLALLSLAEEGFRTLFSRIARILAIVSCCRISEGKRPEATAHQGFL